MLSFRPALLFLFVLGTRGLFADANSTTISAAEYFIDTDPGEGNGTGLFAQDGAFDSEVETIAPFDLNVTGLATGPHQVGIRYKDDNNTWGEVLYRTIHVYDANPDTNSSGSGESGNISEFSTIAGAEYFVGADPGDGNGTAFQAKDGAFDSEVESVLPKDLNVTGLAVGAHQVGVRYKDDNGTWGEILYRTIHVYDANPAGGGGGGGGGDGNASGFAIIKAAEYFVGADPGDGNGTPFQAKDGAFDSEVESVLPKDLNVTGLAVGAHQVGVRYKDDNGTWGEVLYRTIHVYDANPDVNGSGGGGGDANASGFAIIVAAEWFVGADPGEGNATAFQPKDGAFDSEVESVLPTELSTAGFALGTYLVGVRYKDDDGTWGDVLFSAIQVSADTDGDGLLDAQEVALDTNSTNPDSDDDGVEDGSEVALGYDALDANSTPVVREHNVTVANGVYHVNGVHRPILRLEYDVVHRFVLDGNTTQGHPFLFSSHATGGSFAGEIASGVLNSRSTTGTVTLAAHRNLPDYFYYQCGAHPNMGNLIVLGEDYFSGLAGHWTFDETNGTVAHDSSGNDRNGTLTGYDANGTSWTAGKVGGALHFDGTNDYVDVGDFEWGGAISIAAWAKYNAFNFQSRIIDFGNNQHDNIVLFKGTGANGSGVNFHIKRATLSRNYNSTNSFWLSSQWVHAVATVDENGVMKLYRGGSLFDTKTDGWAPNVLTRTKQYVGKSNWSQDSYFEGLIDDLRIYDRALTAKQVTALYQAASRDSDGDGFPDESELAAGTDPTNPDTDGDGTSDGAELAAGTNPADANSMPNQAPTAIDLNGSSVAENLPTGTIVGMFSVTDPNANSTHAITFADGNGSTHNHLFGINPNGTLRTAATFDHEANSTLSIRVRVTDEHNASLQKVFVISVTNVVEDLDGDGIEDHADPDDDGDGFSDVAEIAYGSDPRNNQSVANQAPTLLDLNGTSVAENSNVGSIVGKFSATDPDANATITLTLADGNGSQHNNLFTLDANGTLRTAATFDHEANSTLSIRARVTDEHNASLQKVFVISVTNVVEDLDGDGIEDHADPDDDGDGFSDEQELAAGTNPMDHASVPNHAPTDITLNNLRVAEGRPAGDMVASVGISDPDDTNGTGSYSYALVDGNGSSGNDSFTLDRNGTLRTAQILDYESNASQTIRIRVTDEHNASMEKSFVIEVIDLEESGQAQTSPSVPDLPPWLSEAQPAGAQAPDWYTSDWFGSFLLTTSPWLYHADLGWIYAQTDGSDGIWLWKEGKGWLWTNPAAYPYLFRHENSVWLYFLKRKNGKAWFYNSATKQIE